MEYEAPKGTLLRTSLQPYSLKQQAQLEYLENKYFEILVQLKSRIGWNTQFAWGQ